MKPRPLEPMPNWHREGIYWLQNGWPEHGPKRLTPRQAKRIRLHDNRSRKPVALRFAGLKR